MLHPEEEHWTNGKNFNQMQAICAAGPSNGLDQQAVEGRHSGNPTETDVDWFCVRTQPCRESFAYSFLQGMPDVETFLPRIRYRGTGRRRRQWIVEPLFPGYLFCKFSWRSRFRAVTYSPGILGLIHFGHYYPVIPLEVVQDLQQTFGAEEATEIDRTARIGDRAIVEVGPMRGIDRRGDLPCAA
jgi:Transcription termination factor nusG